jgi:hypothetical protein
MSLSGIGLTAQQTFSAVEQVTPVPPVEVGCPDDTVWDITNMRTGRRSRTSSRYCSVSDSRTW